MSTTVAEVQEQLPAAEDPRQAQREAWEARADSPLMGISLLFLFVLCVPVIWPHRDRLVADLVTVANVVIWAIFAVDYVVRVRLAADRKDYVRHHILDLVVVVVPFLRPLRLLRLFSVTGLLARRSRQGILKEMTKFAVVFTVIVWFLAAVVMLDLERNAAQATITNLPNALWFSEGTLTAVSYGDVFPVTQAGRVVGGALAIIGLVLVGMVTGAIAAWLVTFVTGDVEGEVEAESQKIDVVLDRLEAMEERLLARG